MSRLKLPETNPAVVAAFAAVYLIWGSTYLAIRFAIESLPPFLMTGTRFITAGMFLYLLVRLKGVAAPSAMQWSSAALVGGLLVVGGNGSVVWAEQWVSSGLAALLVASVPFWMVLLEGVRRTRRPAARVAAGLAAGFCGVALLVSPDEIGAHGMHLAGVVALIAASFFWAGGSLLSRHLDLPDSPWMATAIQMLAGGALALLAGALDGEAAALDLARVSLRSLLALGYLILFGSLIAFTAYIWLLRVSTAARVSTYAYVNPVVAVFLGWLIADEPVTRVMLLAAALIIAGVVLITSHRERGEREEDRRELKQPRKLRAANVSAFMKGSTGRAPRESRHPVPFPAPAQCDRTE